MDPDVDHIHVVALILEMIEFMLARPLRVTFTHQLSDVTSYVGYVSVLFAHSICLDAWVDWATTTMFALRALCDDSFLHFL